MLKKFLFAIGGFVLIVAILGGVKASQIQKMSAIVHTPPPSAVTTTEAKSMAWHPTIKSIGTLAPVEGVMLSADAEGKVVKLAVENGAAIKAGDLVVELDTSVEEAQLASAESRAELSRINLDRSKDLWERKANAQSEFDTAQATYKQSLAEVAGLKAQIAKKHILAPFDGRIGIRQVNLGEFVPRGHALMPLQKLNPIYVNFTIPQREIPSLSAGQKISVSIEGHPAHFPGTITAINSEVDAATRNISVQGTLDNPQELLRSGMFAQVEVELPLAQSMVVVPATSIAYASYGNSVFVVEKMKNKEGAEYLGVRQQLVKLGATRGDLVVITEGVSPGEQVVTAGVFKLRNAAPVQVNNVVQPSSNPTPTPHNT